MCVHRSKEDNSVVHERFAQNRMKGTLNLRKLAGILQRQGLFVTAALLLPVYMAHMAKAAPYNHDVDFQVLDDEPQLVPVLGPLSISPPVSGKPGFINGFISSLSMIIVSELGDKTFFIAAIMAMRHPRLTVFAGAITALAFMTVLSALFGFVTTIIPRLYTYYISTALFALFGFKMLYDGLQMSDDEGADELEEVQNDLRQRDEDENTPLTSSSSATSGHSNGSIPLTSSKPQSKIPSGMRRVLFTCFSRVYLQAVTMTFLAEWGDRSQLATVVLAARENIVGICIGGILGHSICTGLAVLGGRMIAQRISVKTVTICGGFVFLGFAIVSLFLNPN